MEISPKDILYQQISEISEPKILKELIAGSKKRIIEEILHRCIPEIAKLSGNVHENFGVFAESISHYLLTNALIPSQRKIIIRNTEVDVIIPDSQTLGTHPENSLVLYFAKTTNEDLILGSLEKMHGIQPHKENIIVIAKTLLKIPYKTYCVDDISSFSKMFDDIDVFLRSKPQSKFKIFKT